MKTIDIQIETFDQDLVRHLMGTSSVSIGQQKAISGGAKVTFQGKERPPTFDVAEIVNLAISFGTGVVSSLVASWISSKLKGRATSLRIDRKKVEIESSDEIVRVINEKIRM